MIAILILQVILLLCLAYLLNCISQRLEELNQKAWTEASKSLQEKPKRSRGTKTPKEETNLATGEISRNFNLARGEGGAVFMPKSQDKATQLIEDNRKEGLPTHLKDLLDDGDDANQI